MGSDGPDKIPTLSEMVSMDKYGLSCLCRWSRLFEGEALGEIITLTDIHPRCQTHAPKPRHNARTFAEDVTARAIAEKIRAELVCCDIYDRCEPWRQAHIDGSIASDSFTELDRERRRHQICYWGEAAARCADDYPYVKEEK